MYSTKAQWNFLEFFFLSSLFENVDELNYSIAILALCFFDSDITPGYYYFLLKCKSKKGSLSHEV